ncbi:putative uncharacterized protein [Xanthomonas citri pv. mangiferaeindicae LMG 941]|nr:putative uncharacterized protein [Xanthomonas citri pv. mangiferaeindicae LMG 941]
MRASCAGLVLAWQATSKWAAVASGLVLWRCNVRVVADITACLRGACGRADVRTSLFTAEDAGDASGAAQAIARLAQLDAAAPSSVAIARSMRRSHARRGTSAQAVPWAGAGPCVGERNAG